MCGQMYVWMQDNNDPDCSSNVNYLGCIWVCMRETGSLTGLRHTVFDRLFQTVKFKDLPVCILELQTHKAMLGFLTWIPGVKFKISFLLSKHFTTWTISSVLLLILRLFFDFSFKIPIVKLCPSECTCFRHKVPLMRKEAFCHLHRWLYLYPLLSFFLNISYKYLTYT